MTRRPFSLLAAPAALVRAGLRAGLVAGLCVGALTGCPPDDEGDDDPDLDPARAGEGEGEGELPPQCREPTNKTVGSQPGAIYFGTRQPTLVPLDAAQVNAVVGISDRFSAGAFCSGTLVSDTVVLTAQHCTVGSDATDLVVLIGEDELAPLLEVAVVEKRETDDVTDMALLRLGHPPADVVDVRPIPITLAPPSADDIGTLLEQAGYGDTHDGSEGRYFVTELFDGLDATYITVNGEGRRGVCFGDSGGPTMHVSAQGDVRVLGVLSFGDPECMNSDNYSRVDQQRAFIEALTGPTPTGEPEPCPASIDAAGSCNVEQALATYCEAGLVVRDACGTDEICGENASGERRCIPVAANPCGAVSAFGECDGETLRFCDDGVVKERDCVACAERCLLASTTEGFACVPSTCGDLDETGVCDGAVSRWCDEHGQLAEYDCAADGQTCRFLGPILGNYCYDEAACEGLTYQGRCNGTVLTWCEDNEVLQYDCADDAQACVDSGDTETGFVCE